MWSNGCGWAFYVECVIVIFCRAAVVPATMSLCVCIIWFMPFNIALSAPPPVSEAAGLVTVSCAAVDIPWINSVW